VRARAVLAVVVAVGCGTAKPTPGTQPVPPALEKGTGSTGAGDDDAEADVGGDGVTAPDPNSNRPTSEARSDFEPCEPTVEDHAAGNRDRYRFEDPATGFVGFKNKAGTVVIAPTFRFAYEFGPGGVSSAVDGVTPFVFIDTAGKVIAKAYAFDNGPDYFQDGLARIVDARGRVGFIDTRGRIVIAPQYDDAASFCHGKAEVAVGAKTFVIDKTGKTVAP
jgi:hypothetical protein